MLESSILVRSARNETNETERRVRGVFNSRGLIVGNDIMKTMFYLNAFGRVLPRLLLLLTVVGSAYAAGEKTVEATSARAPNVYWQDGVHFRSDDDAFRLMIGGRFQVDAASTEADRKADDAFPDLTYGEAEIRRVRLYADALLYQKYGAKVQVDFAYLASPVTPDLLYKDIYVDRRNIPYLGTIRVGHQFEPFSLEDETSTKYITFMERALPTLAFDSDRNTGLLIYNTPLKNRLWWGVGLFIPVVDDEPFDFSGKPGLNVSGRFAGLPWYVDETQFLHAGVSYIHKIRDEDTAREKRINFVADPESHLNKPMLDSGGLIADDADIYNAALALVYGPLSLQGEYYDARVNQIDNPTLHFNGYYAYASYILTGESRPYSAETASFGRLTPHHEFSLHGGGLGAWEVGARYSYLDLNDKNIGGGEQSNVTVGLNWYLNPIVLMRFNYVYAHIEDSDAGASYLDNGHVEMLQMRFQLDF
jgi:phosphate-selective porin OprO/OprP